jgi:translation initiation factor 2 alpha subunit (eIF-2alpha)
MRFYKNEIPLVHSCVVAEFISSNDTIVRVRLPEYNNIEAIIADTSIGKKIKTIRKFISTMKKAPMPFHVQDVFTGEPVLVPITDEKEKATIMNKYKLSREMHSLTLDMIYQVTQNEKVNTLLQNARLDESSRDLCIDVINKGFNIEKHDVQNIKDCLENMDSDEKLAKKIEKIKDTYFKKFLWSVNKKLDCIENIQENTFSYYLENPEELLGFSKLSNEAQSNMIASIKDRLVTSQMNVTSSIDITVTSKNGIHAINKITQMIRDNVDGFYYQDPPHYKLAMRRDNDDECRKVFGSLEEKIKKLSEENDWKVIVHYDPKNEEITERSIKLRPLYRDKHN